MTSEYLQKILSLRMPRRRLLKGAALGGGALGAGALLAACGQGQGEMPKVTPQRSPAQGADQISGVPTFSPVSAVESVSLEKAIFTLGGLQLEINDWQEPDRKGTVGINGVFGKPVEIKAVVRNVGQEPQEMRILDRREENRVFEFNLRSKDGQALEGTAPKVNQDFVEPNVLEQPGGTRFHPLFLPPGFGIPIVIKAEIPKDVGEYQLGVESYDLDMPAPDNFIARGQTVKSSPLVDSNVQRRDWMSLEKVDFGGNGQISLVGIATKRGASKIAQDVRISIFNNLAKDIYLPDGWIKVLVFFADGRVSYGQSEQQYAGGDDIEPNYTAFYDINIGFNDTANPQLKPLYHWETFDFSDSVILVMAYDKWAAWRITQSDWQLMGKG